jgi:hypothetical protein
MAYKFVVSFQRLTVACDSPSDAMAIQNAQAVLENGELYETRPAVLVKLAALLDRYHLTEAANTLRRRACRFRALDLLSRTPSTIGRGRELAKSAASAANA